MSNFKMSKCAVYKGFARDRELNFVCNVCQGHSYVLRLIRALKATFLRFCKKNVTCLGTKVPRVCLFNVVRDKELVCYTGEEYFLLADVVGSLAIGFDLVRNEKLPDVSGLTCARTLANVPVARINRIKNRVWHQYGTDGTKFQFEYFILHLKSGLSNQITG